jgi:hypothetical protein
MVPRYRRLARLARKSHLPNLCAPQRTAVPLHPVERHRAFRWGVYDIETESPDDPTFYGVGVFDGKSYRYFAGRGERSFEEFMDYITSKKYTGMTWFAHFGGRFDVHRVFDYLYCRDRDRIVDMIFSGSACISFRLRLAGHNSMRFCDSYRVLPAGLERLGNEFETRHRKLVGMDMHSHDYNRNDCLCLYEVLERFFEIIGTQAITLASAAMKLFTRDFLQREIYRPPLEADAFIRRSYYGGRNEVYRYDEVDARAYDVNSMYPWAMTGPVPVEFVGWTTRLPDDDRFIGFYEADIDYPELYIPSVPVLDRKQLLFPVGRFRAWVSSIELRRAIEDGARVSIRRGVVFRAEPLLAEYVYELHRRKQEAEAAGRPAERFVWKILLNSLYGKFGERPIKRRYIHDDGRAGVYDIPELPGIVMALEPARGLHLLPHIAATVTSRARARLLAYLRSVRPWYTDTDSVYTPDRIDTGGEIGQMKEEGEGRFRAYRPKEYIFKGHIKVKGIPDEGNLRQLWLEGRPVTFKRHAGLRESMNRGLPASRIVDVTKVRRDVRPKRPRVGDDTRPWLCRNGEMT